MKRAAPWGACLVWCGVAAAQPGPTFDRTVYAMGTRLGLHLDGRTDAVQRASEDAVREVERIEAACSTWRPDSAWSQLNHAGGKVFALAPEWVTLLQAAQDWRIRTDGAFDPVLGALIQAWGTRQGGRTPTPEELAAARQASGGTWLTLDPAQHTARLGHPRAAVEEGGFVKGYALDRAQAVLRADGIETGWLDFGGQLLSWGKPLPVDVADPFERQVPRVRFVLRKGSVSTSGTSEHGRHLLDPRSGTPCLAWGSVTAVADDGLSADVLSLALYVMGPERGLPWADAHGVAAVFQARDAAPRMSRAFAALRPTVLQAEATR